MENNFISADVICKIEINNDESFVAVKHKINIEPTIDRDELMSDSSESIISNYTYNYALIISILSKNNLYETNSNEKQIIEVNFVKEYEKLKKGENIIINGKELDIEGKEFIKYSTHYI